MISGQFHWNGDAAWNALMREYWDRLGQGTTFFMNTVEQAIGVSNPYLVIRKRTRDTKVGKKGSSYRYFTRGSDPGTPPYLRTGHLVASVRPEFDKDKLSSRVSVDTGRKYGLLLELGTKKMDARPWLFATLEKVRPQLAAFFQDDVSMSGSL